MNATASRPQIVLHPADKAVQSRERSGIPEDQHAALDAVILAFHRYEKGDDEAAREALNVIGLQSPFLEWKLLLRGLIAYSNSDDARALENWQRLSADRLPFRLAAPFRAALDPEFRQTQTHADQLAKQYELLTGGSDIGASLQNLNRHFGIRKPLDQAFVQAGTIVEVIKRVAPDTVPKLARIFYHAIQNQGSQQDLARFRKLFGPIPIDPEFHWLEGQIFDAMGSSHQALQHLDKYEHWLATNPLKWPAAEVARARSIILGRMAELAGRKNLSEIEAFRFAFEALMNPRKKPQLPEPVGDPLLFRKRAVEVDPDSEDAVLDLAHDYLERGNLIDTEQLVRAFLARNTESLDALRFLTLVYIQGKRFEESLETHKKILAINPLDPISRNTTGMAYIAYTWHHASLGNWDKAGNALEDGRELYIGFGAVLTEVFQCLRHLREKRPQEAGELQQRILANPEHRLLAAFALAAGSNLFKFKPAERKPFEQLLASILAEPVSMNDWTDAQTFFVFTTSYGLEYRGSKTFTKKLDSMAYDVANTDATEKQAENFSEFVVSRLDWKKSVQVIDLLMRKYPNNPLFCVQRLELEERRRNTRPNWRLCDHLQAMTRRLIEKSADPSHKKLLERINSLPGSDYDDELDH